MKKDVFITIKGIQKVDGESDTTELFTNGSFYKKNNVYYVTYDESEATGFTDSKTTLKIDGGSKVVLFRHGKFGSHLIIEHQKRNIGHYNTMLGDMSIGVYAKEIKSELTDNGGDVYFSYDLDINSSLVSENEVFINIKEN